MIITVDVTQEDIDRGKRRTCSRCPVARAISRATGRKVYCSDDDFCFSGRCAFVGQLGHAAARFIEAFDAFEPVQPFTFTLDIPDQYLPPSVLEAHTK